ncbi:hypothetical protein LX36DRAFT_674544 [Colletotrichum falcatum]|nr:hypothetical protein LX36DRAFT_674544 [Colletotrichum falcatum]
MDNSIVAVSKFLRMDGRSSWKVNCFTPPSLLALKNAYSGKQTLDGSTLACGVTASEDITFKLSAAAKFSVCFVDKWKVNPAAAAVVGEVSLTTKFAAGILTMGTCPFTYGLNVFGWGGGEVNLTDRWEKTIVKGGTCPDLGPIPSKRSLRGLEHLFVEGRAEDEDATRNTSGLEAASPRVAYAALDAESMYSHGAGLRTRRHVSDGHMSLLGKRGGVYGPAFSLPVGEFFCLSLDGEQGTTCEQAYDAVAARNEGDGWRDGATKRKHKREKLVPTSTIDENAVAAQYPTRTPWDTRAWARDLANYARAREIVQKIRNTMGSRVYQSHATIGATMKTQTQRIGRVLGALDVDLLPKNQRAGGYQKWVRQDLEDEWLRYMKGQYTAMQSKTEGLVKDFLPKMVAAWTTQAEKDRWKDAPSDSPATLAEKQEHRAFIKSIEDFETKWNGLPAWTNPL